MSSHNMFSRKNMKNVSTFRLKNGLYLWSHVSSYWKLPFKLSKLKDRPKIINKSVFLLRPKNDIFVLGCMLKNRRDFFINFIA